MDDVVHNTSTCVRGSVFFLNKATALFCRLKMALLKVMLLFYES